MAMESDFNGDVSANISTAGVLELGKPMVGKFGESYQLEADADW